MLTRKLLSVIDTIIVDVFKIICCSEPTDSFIPSQRHCSSTARAQPGHKVLQPEPALEPPAPPGRGGLTILRGLMSQLVKANHTMTQLLRAYRPTSKSVCLNNL